MIVLINPPGFKSLTGLQTHEPNPPIGLAYIASACKQSNLNYVVIDAAGEALDQITHYKPRPDFLVQGLTIEEIVGKIPEHASIIGITCLFSSLWPITRDLASQIRCQFPKAKLILGGEHGTAVWQHVLSTSVFDIVVLGEGDETAVSLFRALESDQEWKDIPGIAYRDRFNRPSSNGLADRKRDVDQIPWPDWESFPITSYINSGQMNGLNMGRSMPLLATRGCPYECTFCSNPSMWTKRYIAREPRKVVDEIEYYINKFNITNVDLQDLTAVVNRKWAIQFAKELINRKLSITWQMPSGTRSEVFDEEVADWLFKSGCRALSFAPETGSTEMLAIIKKKVDLDNMLKSMQIAIRRGFSLSCFIVIGFPNENKKTLRETIHLIRKMAIIGVHEIAVGKFVPYPGSQLFNICLEKGFVNLSDDFFATPMDMFSSKSPSFCENLTAKQLYWAMIWMYANFFTISFLTRPIRTFRIIIRALFTGHEETRYAKWIVDRLYKRKKWKELAEHDVRQSHLHE